MKMYNYDQFLNENFTEKNFDPVKFIEEMTDTMWPIICSLRFLHSLDITEIGPEDKILVDGVMVSHDLPKNMIKDRNMLFLYVGTKYRNSKRDIEKTFKDRGYSTAKVVKPSLINDYYDVYLIGLSVLPSQLISKKYGL